MNLMKMIQNGDIVNLIIMACLFAAIGIMIRVIGKGIAARDAQAALPAAVHTEHKPGNMTAVTAAITAAVNTYKKSN